MDDRSPASSSVAPSGVETVAPRGRPAARRAESDLYAALDLGTNNCRLLIARPTWDSFRVVDAFSRIVRLGEGLTATGRLSPGAIERSIEALKVCRDKMASRPVARMRLVATEACRAAANAGEFQARVEQETGLCLDVIDRATEARLAALGCAPLVDRRSEGVILFDIGGGSSELVWMEHPDREGDEPRIRAWASLPVGVVTLAERHGGVTVTPEVFRQMVAEVAGLLDVFPDRSLLAAAAGRMHMLGTSGTVTTLAGIHLGLPRYERRRVDGIWMTTGQLSKLVGEVLAMSYEERVASPCIGRERADLVLAGCAILEAISAAFPCDRLRVADRGLREGMLTEMMRRDGVWRHARHNGARR